MFWDKNYAPSANLEALLEKKDATVEEFLNEDDILQECNSQKSIMNYFCQPEVIRRLVELITTEPPEELPLLERYRYANIACEILTLGIPSLGEQLLNDATSLDLLYSYLRKEPPLNMLLSSYFVKTFTMFFVRKGERDWFLYQQMCLQLVEYMKSQNDFLDLVCKHFDTYVISGMLLNIMRNIEGGKLKRLLYTWLAEARLVERLIDVMRNPQETNKHANIAEFICDLIQHGREMRQTEEENDTFEPAFAESNPVLQVIESHSTVESILNVILEPNAPQTTVASGIAVLLKLVKPIRFIDEPNSDRQKTLQARERENHEKTKDIVIGVIAPRLNELVDLLQIPPAPLPLIASRRLFGSTRLNVCSVFTALIETKNEIISKAICSTDYFKHMQSFFKEFCWNAVLSAEMEKALKAAFYVPVTEPNHSTSSQQYYNPLKRHGTYEDLDTIIKSDTETSSDQNTMLNGQNNAITNDNSTVSGEEIVFSNNVEQEKPMENIDEVEQDTTCENQTTELKQDETINENRDAKQEKAISGFEPIMTERIGNLPTEGIRLQNITQQGSENNIDVGKNVPATQIQKHLILDCNLAKWLLDCWRNNQESERATEEHRPRRLGYMGHLILISTHIKRSMEQSRDVCSFIESTLADEDDKKLWRLIFGPEEGSELQKILDIQKQDLANYSMNPSEGFFCDTSSWNPRYVRVVGSDSKDDDGCEDDYEDDYNNSDSKHLMMFSAFKSQLTDDGQNDPFGEDGAADGLGENTWQNNYVNFADFETHFSMFSNDLGLDGSSEVPNNIAVQNPFECVQKAYTANEFTQGPPQHAENNAFNHYGSEINATPTNCFPNNYDTNANPQSNGDSLNVVDNENETKILNVNQTENPSTEALNEIPTNSVSVSPSESLENLQLTTVSEGDNDINDDFDDDDGMWTRPLGSGSDYTLCDEPIEHVEKVPAQANMTNGPSAIFESMKSQMLCNDNATITTDSGNENAATAAGGDSDSAAAVPEPSKPMNIANADATNCGELASAQA